jgi:2-alkyl-3-oxoalkanoate reductase
MKVFVAGGSGAVGTRLVPALVEAGHEVVATTRSAGKTDRLRELGAEPVVVDGLDREATIAAVRDSEAEAVVHQLTALTGATNFRRFDRDFALTNRLRTEGTDNLLAGARAAGARRFVAQSFAGWPYDREGGAVKTEDDPLDPDPPKAQRETLAAIRHLEAAVVGAGDIEGIALRYGGFYGPGNALGNGGFLVEQVRKRRVPIVGDGAGVWSFLHIEDAAGAVVAALERGAPGVYNVVDDEPARVSQWLPHLAQVIGAPPPRRVPVWLGRLAAGEVGVSMMTRIRGASNAKANHELGWRPSWPTWRDGFRRGLG